MSDMAHARVTRAARSDLALVGAGLVMLMAVAAALGVTHGASPQRLVLLLLLAPLLEEAVFRAGLQEALLRHGHAAAASNVITALAFGLTHAAARGDASALLVAAPALLVGAVYVRSRSLRRCVVLHAALNALWLAGMAWSAPASLGP